MQLLSASLNLLGTISDILSKCRNTESRRTAQRRLCVLSGDDVDNNRAALLFRESASGFDKQCLGLKNPLGKIAFRSIPQCRRLVSTRMNG